MPRLSDSMEEGTILKWLKSAGEEVRAGEELVEIETDKANMVYEADTTGTLLDVLAQEGETHPVGAVIARIGNPSEVSGVDGAGDLTVEPAHSMPSSGASEGGPAPLVGAPAAPTANKDGRVKASPIARRMANERGLDLGSVSGSGPAGRIVKADVEAALVSGSVSTTTSIQPALSPSLQET